MKKWQKLKQDYFTFSVADKIGIVVLLTIIIAVNAINFYASEFISPEEVDHTDFDEFVSRYNSLIHSEEEVTKKTDFRRIEDQAVEKITREKISKRYSLFEFDPNFVSEEELVKLGFSRYQRSNLLKYRESGGIFFKPDDIVKIYGVDSVLFLRLKSYIKIQKNQSERLGHENKIIFSPIELNKADSADLVKLKGIGPVLARRICRYRNLLGGYVKKEQLQEVYGLKKEVYLYIEDKIWVDTHGIKKIRVSFADYKDLLRHPYINKSFATILVRMRNEKGPVTLHSFEESNEIDSVNVARLKDYLRFD